MTHSKKSAVLRFRTIQDERSKGQHVGIMSVCTAHPLALEAAMKCAQARGFDVLIEATCNQVNQFGGYTGMKPADFRQMVLDLAKRADLPASRILLGGDHLGPNPWRHLSAAEAMKNAEQMVGDYVRAGFEKIHLDCSMPCKDDLFPLDEAIIAQRAAALCRQAETASAESNVVPVYVIGSEVPPPGGGTEAETSLEITKPNAVRETMRLHRAEFNSSGLSDALNRVIAFVVQPGVEFSNNSVHQYQSAAAHDLSAVLADYPGLMFEAHSTDYQYAEHLTELVKDGFCILKVGPWLTYALREALYDLNALYRRIDPRAPDLEAIIEDAMIQNPDHWINHYHGSNEDQAWLRHYSYSDRIRYYWGVPSVKNATSDLIDALDHLDRDTILRTHRTENNTISIPDDFYSIKSIIVDHISVTINKYCDAVRD